MRCCVLRDNTVSNEPRLSDSELLEKFRGGDDSAFDKIASRYLGLISSAAKSYRGLLSNADDSDLMQEGLVALLSACRTFSADKGMSFKNYLMLCVENRYRSLRRSAMRKGAVPLHNIISIENERDSAFDPTESSLSELVETKEYIDSLKRIFKEKLSELEYNVAILYLSGYSYREIADKLSIPLKSVDNAQTRIRQKFSR